MDGSSTGLEPDRHKWRTDSQVSALNGSTNVALRWNYTLGTGELVLSTAWQLDGTQIALIGAVTIIGDDRFDVNKNEVATLIIKNVSELEDATFRYAVQTSVGLWKYDTRLEVTGERWINLILFDRVRVACFKMRVGGGANLFTFLKLTRNDLKNKTKQTKFLSQTLSVILFLQELMKLKF